jgi:hypothetical protein
MALCCLSHTLCLHLLHSAGTACRHVVVCVKRERVDLLPCRGFRCEGVQVWPQFQTLTLTLGPQRRLLDFGFPLGDIALVCSAAGWLAARLVFEVSGTAVERPWLEGV